MLAVVAEGPIMFVDLCVKLCNEVFIGLFQFSVGSEDIIGTHRFISPIMFLIHMAPITIAIPDPSRIVIIGPS